MEIFGYAVPAIALIRGMVRDKPELPQFRPMPWHSKERLDARPVAWSLRNHPEEWRWGSNGRYTIIHIPSGHEFWVANGYGFYRLDERTNCGCSRNTAGRLQRFQQGTFHRAFRHWREAQAGNVNENFANHFIH